MAEDVKIKSGSIQSAISGLNNKQSYYSSNKYGFSSGAYGSTSVLSTALNKISNNYKKISKNIKKVSEYLDDYNANVCGIVNSFIGGSGYVDEDIVYNIVYSWKDAIEDYEAEDEKLFEVLTLSLQESSSSSTSNDGTTLKLEKVNNSNALSVTIDGEKVYIPSEINGSSVTKCELVDGEYILFGANNIELGSISDGIVSTYVNGVKVEINLDDAGNIIENVASYPSIGESLDLSSVTTGARTAKDSIEGTNTVNLYTSAYTDSYIESFRLSDGTTYTGTIEDLIAQGIDLSTVAAKIVNKDGVALAWMNLSDVVSAVGITTTVSLSDTTSATTGILINGQVVQIPSSINGKTVSRYEEVDGEYVIFDSSGSEIASISDGVLSAYIDGVKTEIATFDLNEISKGTLYFANGTKTVSINGNSYVIPLEILGSTVASIEEAGDGEYALFDNNGIEIGSVKDGVVYAYAGTNVLSVGKMTKVVDGEESITRDFVINGISYTVPNTAYSYIEDGNSYVFFDSNGIEVGSTKIQEQNTAEVYNLTSGTTTISIDGVSYSIPRIINGNIVSTYQKAGENEYVLFNSEGIEIGTIINGEISTYINGKSINVATLQRVSDISETSTYSTSGSNTTVASNSSVTRDFVINGLTYVVPITAYSYLEDGDSYVFFDSNGIEVGSTKIQEQNTAEEYNLTSGTKTISIDGVSYSIPRIINGNIVSTYQKAGENEYVLFNSEGVEIGTIINGVVSTYINGKSINVATLQRVSEVSETSTYSTNVSDTTRTSQDKTELTIADIMRLNNWMSSGVQPSSVLTGKYSEEDSKFVQIYNQMNNVFLTDTSKYNTTEDGAYFTNVSNSYLESLGFSIGNDDTVNVLITTDGSIVYQILNNGYISSIIVDGEEITNLDGTNIKATSIIKTDSGYELYNADGILLGLVGVSALSGTAISKYNADGSLAQVFHKDGSYEIYGSKGYVTTRVDAEGNTFMYEGDGVLRQINYIDGTTAVYDDGILSYTQSGSVGNEYIVYYYYDTTGVLAYTKDSLDKYTFYDYEGNILYSYSTEDHYITSITIGDNTINLSEYGINARNLTYEDGTYSFYNADGLLVGTIDASNNISTYYSNGTIQNITTSDGTVTSYTAEGLISKIETDGLKQTYTYESDGSYRVVDNVGNKALYTSTGIKVAEYLVATGITTTYNSDGTIKTQEYTTDDTIDEMTVASILPTKESLLSQMADDGSINGSYEYLYDGTYDLGIGNISSQKELETIWAIVTQEAGPGSNYDAAYAVLSTAINRSNDGENHRCAPGSSIYTQLTAPSQYCPYSDYSKYLNGNDVPDFVKEAVADALVSCDPSISGVYFTGNGVVNTFRDTY